MPLELGEIANLDPIKAKKKSRKSKRVKKPKKGGNWRRLGSWWTCRKCGKQISTRAQSPIPKMICKECQKNDNV